jgi:hypothetical protein
MTSKVITLQGKKLKTLRTILWVCFAGISGSVILFGTIALGAFLMLPKEQFIAANPASAMLPAMTLYALIAILFVIVAAVGVSCLVIYNIFKYRLEKDEELFL